MGRIPRWPRLAVARGMNKGKVSSRAGVTPVGDYMDSILGCGPAGLRQSRGPLGKCSSCDVGRLASGACHLEGWVMFYNTPPPVI